MANNTQELLGTINKSLSDLSKSAVSTEQKLWDKTLVKIKGLEYSNSGNLLQNSNNTKVLGQIKAELSNILNSPGYKAAIVKFGQSYNTVEKLQNEWFSSMVADFKPTGAVQVAKNTAIKQMTDNLIGGGVKQSVVEQVGNIILQDMQTGASISQVNRNLQRFLIGQKNENGALVKYSGQIATDGINQYARAYNLQVVEDLGFSWYQYVGRVKDTTRPFCSAAVKQRYFHKSELGKAAQGVLRSGKVSTEGMYPGMNTRKLLVTAGGYNCNHQFRGVAESNVPLNIRNLFT